MENQGEHARYLVDVDDCDDDGYEDVETCHDGNQEFRDLSNALNTAADHEPREEGQDTRRNILGHVEGRSRGQGNGIGLY